METYYNRDLILCNIDNYSNQSAFSPDKDVQASMITGRWPDKSGLLIVDGRPTYWAYPTENCFKDYFPICSTLYLDNSLSLEQVISTGIIPYLSQFLSIKFYGKGNLKDSFMKYIGRYKTDFISPEEVTTLRNKIL